MDFFHEYFMHQLFDSSSSFFLCSIFLYHYIDAVNTQRLNGPKNYLQINKFSDLQKKLGQRYSLLNFKSALY